MASNASIFITLFLAVFASTAGVGLVAPLLPVYAHEMGAGAFQIGLMFGAFSVTRSLFLPYFGRLSDRKGRKPFIALGLFFYFVLSLVYAFSVNVEMLIAVRLCQGFASAMILPVAQAYVGHISPKNKEGLIMGLFNVALYGGLSVGPVLGGVFRDLFSIRYSFYSMAAICLFGFVLCFMMLPPEEPGVDQKGDHSGAFESYLSLVRKPGIFSLFVFRVGFTTGIGIVWGFLPLFASSQLRLSSSLIGVVLTVNVLVSGIFQVPLGVLADRFNKRFLIVLGGLTAAASLYSMGRADSFESLLWGNALFGLAGGISFPAVMALGVIEGRRGGGMGTIMGLLALAHSVGMFTGPILAGILADLFSFKVIFFFGPLIVIAGTILFLGLPNRWNHTGPT